MFNQTVKDEDGKEYLIIGKTEDENVLHVTELGNKHGGINFCLKHKIAYTNKETCLGCRLDVVLEPVR